MTDISLQNIVQHWLKKRGKLSQAETLFLFDKIKHVCPADYISIQAHWTALYPMFDSIMTGSIDDVNKHLSSAAPMDLLVQVSKFYNEVQEVKKTIIVEKVS